MRSALLVLLIVLALPGCSMLGDSGDAGPAETVTPVPVTDAESVDRGVTTETATPTPGRPDRPDGGEFAGLLDDHAKRIANTSYAYRRVIRDAGDGEGNIPDTTVEGYRGVNGSVHYSDQNRSGVRERVWSNGTVRASARDRGDEIEYDAGPAPEGRNDHRQGGVERLRRLFEYAQPTAISENDTHYRIEAEFVRRNGDSILGPDATVEYSSLSMSVTKAGLIESYRIVIHGEREDGEGVDIVERFALDQSVDTLPRPGWVDRAIEHAREEQFGNRIEGFGYVAEHEAALESTAYAYRMVAETDSGGFEGLHNETIRGYSGKERGVLLFNRTIVDDDRQDVTWSNGTVTATKNVDGGSTSYFVDREAAAFSGRDADRLRQRLEFAEITERRTNGTHELIEATLVERDGTSMFGPDVTVENSSLSVVVAEDGVIEAYDLAVTVVNEDGERATLTERFRLDRSADALPRPDWVDRALADVTNGRQ